MNILQEISKFLKGVYQTIDDKQGDEITVIDFANTSPLYDYMIIASARNERLAAAIIDAVEEYAMQCNCDVKSISKVKDSKWFLIDLGDIVCHIFYDGQREFYDLEGLWKDLGTLKM